MRNKILILLFTILASTHVYADSGSPKYSIPAFSVGRSHVRNLLLFIWSADSVESAQAYNNIIMPLNGEIKDGYLRVIMMQIDDGSKNDHDTGPLLLCANNNYNNISMEYLNKFDGKFTSVRSFSVANTLISIGTKFGLPTDVTACHSGVNGRARRDRLTAMSKAIRSKLKVERAPAFFFNSKRIYPSNPDDIRSILK